MGFETMESYHNESTERLFRVFLNMRSEEEWRCLFDDLCTIKEVQDMAQRMDTALLLDAGKSYQSISKELGISTATISRVNRCLNYGSGGYRLALDRYYEKEQPENADRR